MKHLHLIVLGLSLVLLYLMVLPLIDVVVYSIFIYYISRPLYHRLSNRIKSPTTRALATITILVLPTIILLLYVFSVGAFESMNFLQSMNIQLMDTVKNTLNRFSSLTSQLSVADVIASLEGKNDVLSLWNIGSAIAFKALGILFKIFLTLTITFYLLVDCGRVFSWVEKNINADDAEYLNKLFREVDHDLSEVFLGSILTGIWIAFIAIVWFNLWNILVPGLSVPYTMLLAIICGLTSLVPGLGVALVWIPVTVYLAFKAAWSSTLVDSIIPITAFMVLTAMIVDHLPNLFLRPKVSSKRLHNGLLMLSYVFGPIAFGIMGIILGPMILVIAVNAVKHAGKSTL